MRVAVAGAAGRMGREVLRAVSEAHDMSLAAAIDLAHVGQPASILAPEAPSDVLISNRLAHAIEESRAEVLVDFTIPGVAADHAVSALQRGVSVVIGTSGLSGDEKAILRRTAEEHSAACALIPNFALGAVLMMKFAEEAARWMRAAEVIEMHHDRKVDSPSGTARHTAELIARSGAGAGRPMMDFEHARGQDVEGVPVHSIRLPGLVAHQKVLFGGEGELLTIQHDSMDRRGFMAGVLLAIREIPKRSGLIVGLDHLMFG